ncbi:uncharacterized protein [Triticum aestivum]|uniref:uncharacterized protein n=1 Tax=Triticum aestivum TaxID=4565 RepID=UPI001D024F52|nr:uncharacterized protein LOC123143500 [Triticum aestivum]
MPIQSLQVLRIAVTYSPHRYFASWSSALFSPKAQGKVTIQKMMLEATKPRLKEKYVACVQVTIEAEFQGADLAGHKVVSILRIQDTYLYLQRAEDQVVAAKTSPLRRPLSKRWW